MKRALLTSALYFPNVGGVENSIREINASLKRQGWDVDIVVSDNHVGFDDRLSAEECFDNEKVYRYKYRGRIGPIFQFLRIRKKIKERCAGVGYDLVIARNHHGVLGAKVSGVKNIIYIPPGIVKYQNKQKFSFCNPIKFIWCLINSFFQFLAFFLADRVCVFSSEMQDQVRRFTLGRIYGERVRPGVDAERFRVFDGSDPKGELGLKITDKVILCLGRFSVLKGFDYAIEAMSYLDDDYKLIIVGEGPELDSYKAIVFERGLGKRILFFPRTNSPEFFYGAADLFAMTSIHETFGQTLLEATAAGVPIVAFRSSEKVHTATSEIYREYRNLVRFVDVVSAADLADAIKSSMIEVGKLSGAFKEERLEFLDNYSWEKLVLKLVS